MKLTQLMLLIALTSLAVPSAGEEASKPTAEPNPSVQKMPGPPRFPFDACHDEISRLCGNEKEERAVGQCLFKHDKEVSANCKEGIERMLLMSRQAALRGGGALGSFGGTGLMAGSVGTFMYSGTLSPETSGPALSDQRLNLSVPLFHNAEESMSASLAGGAIHFNDPITLGSGTPVPQNLYRAEVGAQYTHQLADKKNWSARGSFGYAGDKLFQSLADTTFSVSGSYGFPGDATAESSGYWILSVFLANNSPLVNYIPIPGILYLYRTAHFTGVIGFPIMSLQWTPDEFWSYSLSLFGPTVNGEIAHGRLDSLQEFFGASWIQQYFLRDARTQSNYRMTLDEKKVFVGARTPLFLSLLAELQVGAALDRSVYEGKGLLNRDGGGYQMGNSWFTTATLRAAF